MLHSTTAWPHVHAMRAHASYVAAHKGKSRSWAAPAAGWFHEVTSYATEDCPTHLALNYWCEPCRAACA